MSVKAGDIVVNLRLEDKDFNVTVRNADRLLSSLTGNFNRTGRAVQSVERHFSSFTTRFRHAVQLFASARFALMDFHEVFLSLPGAVLKASGEFERMTVLMTGLSKETDVLKRRAEGLSNTNFAFDLAKTTPFEVKAITDAMVKFKASGLDPTNGSVKALLNGIAQFGGSSEHIHRAAIAIQQMGGKGVISMEELRQQLGEAIPTAMQLMADATGMSMGELVKLISKGVVESKSALNLLFSEMDSRTKGAASDLMATWVGALAQLNTFWELFKKSMGDVGFAEEAKRVLKDVIDIIRSPDAARVASQIGELLTTTLQVLVSMGAAVRDNWQGIQALGAAMLAIWSAGRIQAGITTVSAGIQAMTFSSAGFKNAIIANHAQINAAYMSSALTHQGVTRAIIAEQQLLASAEQIVNTRRLANGQFASSALIALKTAEIAKLRESIAMHAAEAAAIARSATAARGFGMVAGFITGPLGLIATALGIGITLWQMWGDSGAEAYEKIRKAAAGGFATEKNLADLNKQIIEREKKIKDLANQIAAQQGVGEEGTGIGSRPGRANLDLLRKDLDEEVRSLADMRQTRNNVESGLRQQETNRSLQQYRSANEDFERAVSARYNNEIDILKKANAGKKLTDEQYRKEVGSKIVEFRKQELQELIAYYEEVRKTNAAQSKQTNDAFFVRAADALTRKGQLEDQLAARGQGPTILNKGGTGTSRAALGPFARALAMAKAEVAELEQLTQMLIKGTDQLVTEDSVRAQVTAKLVKQWEEGVFDRVNGKDKSKTKLPRAELDKLIDVQSKAEFLKAQSTVLDDLIRKNKELEEASRDAFALLDEGKITQQTSGMRSLERFFELLALKVKFTGQALENFEARRASALSTQATTDLNLLVAGFADKTRDIRASLADDALAQRQQVFDKEVGQITKLFNARLNALRKEGESEEAFMQRTSLQRELFYDYMKALADKHARDIETPLQRMARDWQDAAGQMRQASVGWANQSIDAIVKMVKTGKFEFSTLADSIITDILRIQLQKRLAEPLSKGLDGLIEAILGTGGSGGGGGGVEPAFDYGFDGTGIIPNANGGIMTNMGAVALRKYANGGIASSPQLAMFGEGSRPEAYVPLPDGRSIPVSMRGGMPAVTVNVINQSGTQVTAKQGQPRIDGRQMVLDVVLSAASQPGPFRDNMKQAMK